MQDKITLTPISESIHHLSGSATPLWNREICSFLASKGINSLLVVADDDTPFPSMQSNNIWSYSRPLKSPTAISPSELARITDFARYELSHNRTMAVWIGYPALVQEILRALAQNQPHNPAFDPSDACCCRPFQEGCRGGLVCHGTTIESARQIFETGRIMSKKSLSKLSDKELLAYSARESVGDPPDFMEYVHFSNGDCIAPDLVVASRISGKFVMAAEVDKAFYPAVRFYFRYPDLAKHPVAAWDGIHPVKIQNELELKEIPFVAVCSTVTPDGSPMTLKHKNLRMINHSEYPSLARWSNAAYEMALQNSFPEH